MTKIKVVLAMKVRILTVGNKMPKWVQTGFDEYFKRIQPMLSTEIVEIAAAKRAKTRLMPIWHNTVSKKDSQY